MRIAYAEDIFTNKIAFLPSVAEQLYLAVEHRCDLNQLESDTSTGSDKNVFLDMEDQQAEQWLRQSAVSENYKGFGRDRWRELE